MNKPVEVKEFTRIFCEGNVREEDCTTVPKRVFDDLERFLLDFSESGLHSGAADFLKIGSQKYRGKYLSVNNFVGVIQTAKGNQLQILPKIDLGGEEDDEEERRYHGKTKAIFLRMIRSLRNVPFRHLDTTDLRTARLPIFEIFIHMYLEEAMTLAKRGLKSSYVEHEDNLRFYKGKLQAGTHIRLNAVHKERFYMRYDEYDLNRPENRLIKSTLLKLMALSTDPQNQKEIRQILTFFELVEPSLNYERDFSLVKNDRTVRDYEMLLQWSKVFLFNQSFSTFTGQSQSWALLFPMETVFESYVAQELRKVFADTSWTVSVQNREQWLFNFPHRRFRLKPDIVITKEDGTRIILDTKWKALSDNERNNYDISQADMYQMFAYSKKYAASDSETGVKSPDVWLLYPVNSSMRKYTECGRTIEFASMAGNEKDVRVRLFFVDLKNIGDSMQLLKSRLTGIESETQ